MGRMKRYLLEYIKEDLNNKMVFVGGPRQVGKTTLANSLLDPKTGNGYLSWDSSKDRKKILAEELPIENGVVVFDELHKYARWRNLIKGLYDKNKAKNKFLITGSARLDYYRRGGDSLQGRYHYYRLHPISLGELIQTGAKIDLDALFKYGGFPEPFLKANMRFWRRWQNERISKVVHEDLRDLEKVNEISQIGILAETLESKVGSPLSIQSLATDLEVAHKTAKRWVTILSNLYFCFMIPPFGSPKIRAVKKEQKLYLWDWSLCLNEGARFENLVACQLLKYCHFIEDTEGFKMELRYIRDSDKREVDFVVLKDKKPEFAVECKFSDKKLSPHLSYFKERTSIKKFYQVFYKADDKNYSYTKNDIKVLSFEELVKELGLP
jgi:uncharacterized protein